MFYSINGSHPFVFQNLKYIYIIKINKKFPKKTTRRIGTNWTPFKAKTYTLEGKEDGGRRRAERREKKGSDVFYNIVSMDCLKLWLTSTKSINTNKTESRIVS